MHWDSQITSQQWWLDKGWYFIWWLIGFVALIIVGRIWWVNPILRALEKSAK